MPVKVRCTSCEKVLTVPDSARGKAVKCPNCEERIAVPEEDSSSVGLKVPGKGSGDKIKKKAATKPTKPADSEDALASFDLRKAEDTNARICAKCGFDMKYQDEEDAECPKCGHDVEAGGQGKKAQKRAMRGPDPADFYPGLAKSSWKFVVKNINLAWRTDAYVTVCLLISLLCSFLYLWLSPVPPRAFFVLCFTVAFMVIPGWLWLMDIEVIQLTLERKDKFKRVNFDFFLASAMGIMFLGWLLVIAAPLMIVPLGIGYYLVNFSGSPPWVYGVCAGIGLIPALWMLPVSMSHMSMPISTPGWMIWKVVPLWFKNIKPLSVWMLWLFLTTLPLTTGAAVIGGVWGNSLNTIVTTMESNASTHRARLAAENAPKGKNAPPQADPSTIGQIADVDLKPLIGPVIILLVMCLPVGFIGLFLMRINGQFTYYHKNRLEMIDKRKEYKYVAKEKKEDDDDDDKPKTDKQVAADSLVVALLGAIIGLVGGVVYSSVANAGMTVAIITGIAVGLRLVILVSNGGLILAVFRESVGMGFVSIIPIVGVIMGGVKYWQQTRQYALQYWFSAAMYLVLTVVVIALALSGAAPIVEQQPPPAGVPAMAPAGAGTAIPN